MLSSDLSLGKGLPENKVAILFAGTDKKCTFVLQTSRDGAVVARWAHNPKVIGSSPVPATKQKEVSEMKPLFFVFYSYQ